MSSRKSKTKTTHNSGRPRRSDSVGRTAASGALGLPAVRNHSFTLRIRERIAADVKRIRLLWARGKTDMEIRRALNLEWPHWKARLRAMRALPPDEDVYASYRRYHLEHEKFKARMERSLLRLDRIHKNAVETVTIRGPNDAVITRPRNYQRSLRALEEINRVNEALRQAEEKLLAIKKGLNIIEDEPVQKGLFSTTNVREAWQRLEKEENASGSQTR